MNEQHKAEIAELGRICEMRMRMANASGAGCADESTDWAKVDRQIAERYSIEAFRIAQEAR